MATEARSAQVRAAMERLLTGRAIHAGDRLDIVGLALEAGVKRQVLYRAHPELLAEFRAHRLRLASATVPERRTAQLEALKAELEEAKGRAARYRNERDAARSERDANASQVIYLMAQNTMLRDQLTAAGRIRTLPTQA